MLCLPGSEVGLLLLGGFPWRQPVQRSRETTGCLDAMCMGCGVLRDHHVPSPSNKYRDRVFKSLEMTGIYHTIMKFPELDPDIYLTEQLNGVGTIVRASTTSREPGRA